MFSAGVLDLPQSFVYIYGFSAEGISFLRSFLPQKILHYTLFSTRTFLFQIMFRGTVPRGNEETEVVLCPYFPTCFVRRRYGVLNFPGAEMVGLLRPVIAFLNGIVLKMVGSLQSCLPRETVPQMLFFAGISVLFILLGAGFREGTKRPKWSHALSSQLVLYFEGMER